MLTIWWESIDWEESYSIGFADAQQQAVGLRGKVECIGLPMLTIWCESIDWEESYSIGFADAQQQAVGFQGKVEFLILPMIDSNR